jgi:hypothetical protein
MKKRILSTFICLVFVLFLTFSNLFIKPKVVYAADPIFPTTISDVALKTLLGIGILYGIKQAYTTLPSLDIAVNYIKQDFQNYHDSLVLEYVVVNTLGQQIWKLTDAGVQRIKDDIATAFTNGTISSVPVDGTPDIWNKFNLNDSLVLSTTSNVFVAHYINGVFDQFVVMGASSDSISFVQNPNYTNSYNLRTVTGGNVVVYPNNIDSTHLDDYEICINVPYTSATVSNTADVYPNYNKDSPLIPQSFSPVNATDDNYKSLVNQTASTVADSQFVDGVKVVGDVPSVSVPSVDTPSTSWWDTWTKSVSASLDTIGSDILSIPKTITDFFTVDWTSVTTAMDFTSVWESHFKPFYDITGAITNINSSPDSGTGKFYMVIPKAMGGNDTSMCVLDYTVGGVYVSWARTFLEYAIWIAFGWWILEQFKPKINIS